MREELLERTRKWFETRVGPWDERVAERDAVVGALDLFVEMLGASDGEHGRELQVRALVSASSGQPMVSLTWGTHVAQMSSTEAAVMGEGIVRAALAAELDAQLVGYLREEMSMTSAHAGFVVGGVRTRRSK